MSHSRATRHWVRFSLRECLCRETAVSRNLGESRAKRTVRLLWAVRYWFTAIRVGIKFMRRPTIGSRVRCRGQVWRIVNWAWFPNQRCQVDGQDAFADISPDECEPIRTPREFWHRFRSGYEWWGTCWHGIHVSEALYPRDAGTPGGGQ